MESTVSVIEKPSLSVVTVVFNNVQDIERTIKSVVGQTYHDIEYIVVDGASTDGTWQIIEKYADQIAIKLSEPDLGIYDAMNKGLARATKSHVVFMNSGDEFYAEDTVEKVFASTPSSIADIYYGETELYNHKGESQGLRRHAAPEHFNWRSFKYGMSICHQSIYIKKSLTSPYNLDYQLSADIDWVITAAKKAENVVNAKILVTKYLIGGISQKRHQQSLKERFQILSKHYGLLPNVLNHLIIAGRLLLYYVKFGKPKE